MKVFIVFIGLLVLFASAMSYQSDLGRYIVLQNDLKALAEESAAGAALYFDELAYAEGELCFNQEEGGQYVDYLVIQFMKEKSIDDGKLSYEICFQDDLAGYSEPAWEGVSGYKAGIPSVTIRFTYVADDFFRLPFLEVRSVTRMACYELPQSF